MTQFKIIGMAILIVFGLRAIIILGFLFWHKKTPWILRNDAFKETKPGKVIYNRYLTFGLIIITFLGFFVYMDNESERNLTRYRTTTVGDVSFSGSGRNRGNSVSVRFYDENKKEYYASARVSDQEVEFLREGQLFTVAYSYKNPDFSEIILDEPIVPDGDSLVKRLGKVLEIVEKDDYLSIFYRFHFNGIPYDAVRFAPLNTKIAVGEEYYVEFPLRNPGLGVLHLNEKLDIMNLIESAEEPVSE